MFDFLPPLLRRLYRGLVNATPYAPGTRVRETPAPDPEIAVSMRERMFRVEIVLDAFCERRPTQGSLFRTPSGHRGMESWCERRGNHLHHHRCPACTDLRALASRANQGDWQAEVRLHRLATRASMRLLAERRAWAETRRRQRAARTPEPAPPPVIWIILGWKRWRDRRAADPGPWFIVERRAAEAKLVRAHTRTLQRMAQRSRARARDRELARERAIVGWTSAAQSTISPTEQAADAPAPSSRGAQRRGDPGQRDRRLPRGPGSPRHQKATRDDDAHAHAPSE